MLSRWRSLCIIFSISLVMIMYASAWAETIRLKNGRIFDAVIVERKGEEIKVIMKSGVVTFYRNEIDTIDGRKLTPPAPAKKPVAKTTVKSSAAASKPVQKKQQKAVPEVKQQSTRKKAAQPENPPAVSADTATVSKPLVSTNTASSASKAPISTSAVIFAIFILAIFAFIIVLMIKRIKRQ